MYCIECGAQIPDNSKFCSHCGHNQTGGEPSLKEKKAEVIIDNENTQQLVEENKSSIDYQFLKKTMGWYLAWVLLHLGILLIFSLSIFATDYTSYMSRFVPFSESSSIEYYDFREFLVYTIFPLAILVILSMVRTQEAENNTNNFQNEQ